MKLAIIEPISYYQTVDKFDLFLPQFFVDENKTVGKNRKNHISCSVPISYKICIEILIYLNFFYNIYNINKFKNIINNSWIELCK